MESQTRQALLFGLYAQESFRPVPKALVDVGARLDVIDFTINSDQTSDYNWSTGAYTTFPLTNEEVSKSYTSFSPRIGASYELSELFNVFVSASTGVQSPSEGEINDNPDLELVETQSYEVGLKGRSENWNFDASVYYSPVKNEVIKVLNNGRTSYANAGKTNKQGVELSGSYTILKGLKFGASYTYSDFTFDEFSENVGFGPTARSVDRSGNRLPYVPQHQYSLFAAYKHPSGFKAKIQAHTWGSYFMDNGNTEKYDGYEFVTNLMLGYETDKYDISLNVDNLFDDRYAVEATKDLRGEKDYKPAGPRSIMLRFTYKF